MENQTPENKDEQATQITLLSLMFRLRAIQSLLINKGILNHEEIMTEEIKLAKAFSEQISNKIDK